MDVTEEHMTVKEMLEKIAELEYSQSQLRDLNAEMRHWLDAADDEVAMLRSENASFRKQVKALEKIISEAQQVEAETCGSLLGDDLDLQRRSEQKIQELEKDSTLIKEENKRLTAELKSLQQERCRDKISLNEFKVSLQALECGIEEAQLRLQERDEIIHEEELQLQHWEETVEEYSNIIKDLRLTNQELRNQLEERQDEASLAFLNDVMAEKEGLLSLPLSFAEEMKLLASSATVSDSDHRHEETETEELLTPPSLTKELQTERCAGVLVTAVHSAGMFVLFVVTLVMLAFLSGSLAGHSDFFSINTLWSGASLILQPYCRVHYGALPPV
ncbi:uncharacterized protein AB9X84_024528 [Acanthopagrus schlegelii]